MLALYQFWHHHVGLNPLFHPIRWEPFFRWH